MLLVDDERAATRRRLPVHTPHTVAGLVEPEIGELDPLALLPGDEVADVRLGVARADDLAEVLLPRIDAEKMSRRQLALEDEEAEPVERGHAHAADPEHAPPRKAQRGGEVARLAGWERDAERRVAFGNHVAWHCEPELETIDPARRHEPDLHRDDVALQHPRAVDTNVDVELGRCAGEEPDGQHEHERRGEHDELRASGGNAGKETEGAERRVARELRCRGARHDVVRTASSALGVGTASRHS